MKMTANNQQTWRYRSKEISSCGEEREIWKKKKTEPQDSVGLYEKLCVCMCAVVSPTGKGKRYWGKVIFFKEIMAENFLNWIKNIIYRFKKLIKPPTEWIQKKTNKTSRYIIIANCWKPKKISEISRVRWRESTLHTEW